LTVLAQKDFVEGFVVLESKDTVFGTLENKSYYSSRKIKLYQGDSETWYSRKTLSAINIDNVLYVKSVTGILNQRFFKKEISGYVNLYSLKKYKGLGGFDTDISIGKMMPTIKFYCSDYPNLSEVVKDIDEDNIGSFIIEYNDWKSNHPSSKSFFENNIHHKPLINIKMSFLIPGLGFEFRLSDKVSVSTMLKSELVFSEYDGLLFNPFLDTQLRYYYNIEKRKQENIRTYKYSGNYVSFFNYYYYLFSNTNLNGVLYGWQRVINKYYYYNLGIGAGKWTIEKQYFTIIFNFDFGFKF
jgi:hypothetical protein